MAIWIYFFIATIFQMSFGMEVQPNKESYYGIVGGTMNITFNIVDFGTETTYIIDVAKNCDSDRNTIAFLNVTNSQQQISYIGQFLNRMTMILAGPKIYLYLKNLKADDFGCKLDVMWYTKFVKKVGYTNMLAAIKPSILRSSHKQNETLRIGNNQIYTCRAEGAPIPFVSWFILKGEDANTALASGTGSASFAITSAQLEDTNNYVCKARNINGTAEWEMSLIVQYLELVSGSVEYIEKNVEVDDTVSQKCPIDGYPGVMYKWFNPQDGVTETKRTLYLGNFKPSEYGNYTCKATNSAGEKIFVLNIVPPNGKTTPVTPDGQKVNTSKSLLPSIMNICIFNLILAFVFS